jgi:predicted aldo/keto reductase-like oxidoreductase
MSDTGSAPLDRRAFIQGTAAATAAVALSGTAVAAQEPAPVLPTRVLGKTGVEVTLLNQGTVKAPSALERLLRFSYGKGVRYYDTAAGYGTEPSFKKWFEQMPEVRKQIFLATKQGIHREPADILKHIDERLASLGTDYIDLLFFHGLSSEQVDWPKSKAMKEACAAVRKTGKVRFVGFTTHDARRAEQLQAAADGGFVDVVMVQFTPWLEKDSDMNRALDACHAKNIGLVSMKQFAGHALRKTEEIPALKERGLNAYQGLLHAIWSDERIASACVTMMNLDEVTQNVTAAASYRPLDQASIGQLRDTVLAAGPTLCADCDGRCARAAGTRARLGDLTRYLTYHEHHGARRLARQEYAALAAEERDWTGADLEAARQACPSRLDFARLLPEADRLLG